MDSKIKSLSWFGIGGASTQANISALFEVYRPFKLVKVFAGASSQLGSGVREKPVRRLIQIYPQGGYEGMLSTSGPPARYDPFATGIPDYNRFDAVLVEQDEVTVERIIQIGWFYIDCTFGFPQAPINSELNVIMYYEDTDVQGDALIPPVAFRAAPMT